MVRKWWQPEEVISRIRSTTYWHFRESSAELFDVRAKDINDEMKIAAAKALAGLISDEELNEDYIIPAAFDERVGGTVARRLPRRLGRVELQDCNSKIVYIIYKEEKKQGKRSCFFLEYEICD